MHILYFICYAGNKERTLLYMHYADILKLHKTYNRYFRLSISVLLCSVSVTQLQCSTTQSQCSVTQSQCSVTQSQCSVTKSQCSVTKHNKHRCIKC